VLNSYLEWIEQAEPFAYGVLGLSPKEFGEMTLREFSAKLTGFSWLRMAQACDRAEIMCAVYNASGNLRKGTKMTVRKLCPIQNPPNNIFFRRLVNV